MSDSCVLDSASLSACAASRELRYNPRCHAAFHTDHYVFHHLIPYIGNKRKLLPLIQRAIAFTGMETRVFADYFSGSSVVSRMAKWMGLQVVSNDWEPYAQEIARGTVACNYLPPFVALGGPGAVFQTLNCLPPIGGYLSQNYCPRDDLNPDPDQERMFFTQRNGQRLDAMREQIAIWDSEGAIDQNERAVLLSALSYTASYVSNTSGLFKGFHRGWGGQTGTALHRILSGAHLTPPLLWDNGKKNIALGLDAQELAVWLRRRYPRHIAYLDPPYNQHPYGSNYHLLNTITLWDKPEVGPVTIAGRRSVNKAAIRTDWRTARRSPFNHRDQALDAFAALLDQIEAPWIIVSYSTDGNIDLRHLLDLLSSHGQTQVFPQRYKRYRVSAPRMSPRSHNVEFALVVNRSVRSTPGSVARLEASIWGAANANEEMAQASARVRC